MQTLQPVLVYGALLFLVCMQMSGCTAAPPLAPTNTLPSHDKLPAAPVPPESAVANNASFAAQLFENVASNINDMNRPPANVTTILKSPTVQEMMESDDLGLAKGVAEIVKRVRAEKGAVHDLRTLKQLTAGSVNSAEIAEKVKNMYVWMEGGTYAAQKLDLAVGCACSGLAFGCYMAANTGSSATKGVCDACTVICSTGVAKKAFHDNRELPSDNKVDLLAALYTSAVSSCIFNKWSSDGDAFKPGDATVIVPSRKLFQEESHGGELGLPNCKAHVNSFSESDPCCPLRPGAVQVEYSLVADAAGICVAPFAHGESGELNCCTMWFSTRQELDAEIDASVGHFTDETVAAVLLNGDERSKAVLESCPTIPSSAATTEFGIIVLCCAFVAMFIAWMFLP